MVVNCNIEFDQNPKGTFYAGEILSGTIHLSCDKVKEVKAIVLEITGRAEAVWTERQYTSRRIYHGVEDYLSMTTYLLGSEQSSKTTVGIGAHKFTFACQIPAECPSSFEGQHGHVRYTAKVSFLRPWKFDQNYRRGFTVIRVTDLNFESPHIRIPSLSEAYKMYGCGPCTTEPLKLELKVPQAGFVPGQNIPVQALIINNTSIQVSEVKFALVMLVRYISQSPKHTYLQRISVSKMKSDSVLRNCTRSLAEELHVPATPPTSLQSCGVIQIVYQVEMEVKMRGLHRCQMVTIPVIIGTVPLANNLADPRVIQEQPMQSFRERPSNTDVLKEEGESLDTFEINTPDMPPPSYEESVHTQRNNINEGDEQNFGYTTFAPLYPVFDVGSPVFEKVPMPEVGGGTYNKSFVS